MCVLGAQQEKDEPRESPPSCFEGLLRGVWPNENRAIRIRLPYVQRGQISGVRALLEPSRAYIACRVLSSM